jgi:hypothetical protein
MIIVIIFIVVIGVLMIVLFLHGIGFMLGRFGFLGNGLYFLSSLQRFDLSGRLNYKGRYFLPKDSGLRRGIDNFIWFTDSLTCIHFKLQQLN